MAHQPPEAGSPAPAGLSLTITAIGVVSTLLAVVAAVQTHGTTMGVIAATIALLCLTFASAWTVTASEDAARSPRAIARTRLGCWGTVLVAAPVTAAVAVLQIHGGLVPAVLSTAAALAVGQQAARHVWRASRGLARTSAV